MLQTIYVHLFNNLNRLISWKSVPKLTQDELDNINNTEVFNDI